MRYQSRLIVALLGLTACADPQKTGGDAMYSHSVQLVHFRHDQVEERGEVSAEGAVSAFREFPFEEQIRQAETLPSPTFPTVSFRSQSDGSVLAVWSLEPGLYEVYLEADGKKVTAETTDAQYVEQAIRSFFSGGRAVLLERLSETPNAVTASRGVWGWLKSMFGRR